MTFGDFPMNALKSFLDVLLRESLKRENQDLFIRYILGAVLLLAVLKRMLSSE